MKNYFYTLGTVTLSLPAMGASVVDVVEDLQRYQMISGATHILLLAIHMIGLYLMYRLTKHLTLESAKLTNKKAALFAVGSMFCLAAGTGLDLMSVSTIDTHIL